MKVSITKSRSGHYSVTASHLGIKHTIGKLPSLWHAQQRREEAIAEVHALADKYAAKLIAAFIAD